jgi:hypothetical protein
MIMYDLQQTAKISSSSINEVSFFLYVLRKQYNLFEVGTDFSDIQTILWGFPNLLHMEPLPEPAWSENETCSSSYKSQIYQSCRDAAPTNLYYSTACVFNVH